jgi:predicted RNA binding protein YcfA (HicA-like mRNA interferase family)
MSAERVTVRDLIHRLEAAGWQLKTIRGSHRQYRHLGKGMVVTVTRHPGRDVPVGTLPSPQRRTRGEGEERMRFTVIYEKGPTSWGAYVPDLPGVISVGWAEDDEGAPFTLAAVQS